MFHWQNMKYIEHFNVGQSNSVSLYSSLYRLSADSDVPTKFNKIISSSQYFSFLRIPMILLYFIFKSEYDLQMYYIYFYEFNLTKTSKAGFSTYSPISILKCTLNSNCDVRWMWKFFCTFEFLFDCLIACRFSFYYLTFVWSLLLGLCEHLTSLRVIEDN